MSAKRRHLKPKGEAVEAAVSVSVSVSVSAARLGQSRGSTYGLNGSGPPQRIQADEGVRE
jgi:hypothetical protein